MTKDFIQQFQQHQQSNQMTKPFLRGHFHQAAFFLAIGACAMLLAKANNKTQIWGLCIYSICLMLLFGVSALYHRINWNPRLRMWMRRLDHGAIFALIAGTGTPIFLIGLPEQIGNKLMWITWSCAALGILQSLFWPRAPKWISAIIYLGAGWVVVPYFSQLSDSLGSVGVGCLLTGGILYTIGALVYAFQKPNPSPKIFGYHEIFHLLVVIAAGFHFMTVYSLVS